MMVAYNKLPAVDSPKLHVAIETCMALEVLCCELSTKLGRGEGGVIFYLKNSGIHLSIKVDYGTPSSIPTFLLPDGVTRASLGRKMADFPSRRNFLDEYLFNLQWRRQRGLWSSLLNAERGGGVVQEGNLLDWRFTQFPQVLRRLITRDTKS